MSAWPAYRGQVQTALPLGQQRDALRAQLIALMSKRHMGRRRGISATALAAKLAITERTLRHLISDAREEGVAIVGTPETGYYIARTAGELEECCRFLRARAMHSLAIEARLRRIALPELLGQLRVGT